MRPSESYKISKITTMKVRDTRNEKWTLITGTIENDPSTSNALLISSAFSLEADWLRKCPLSSHPMLAAPTITRFYASRIIRFEKTPDPIERSDQKQIL